MIENLDYIQELGATCIYMNPIFAAGEYHKYDLLDYHHIDPCFGTDEDFRQLVNDCHARGMRVIIDGVFNHVGWNFFRFLMTWYAMAKTQNIKTGFTICNSL